MKKRMIVAAAAMLTIAGLASGTANAAGCVKGAVIGGVAGHVVGGHGLLGAGVGCVIGSHEANRRGGRDQNWDRNRGDGYRDRGDGYGSSREPNYRYRSGSEYYR